MPMNKKKILILNGPNLNLLGRREQSIYGDQNFENYLSELKEQYADCELSYFQSNHEGILVDTIQLKANEVDAIILNAAAYTHTSIAIRDAIAGVNAHVVEVHISNIYEREQFRHHSYISKVSAYTIIGHGLDGYRMSIETILNKPTTKSVQARIEGKVQGVFFRYSTKKEADKLKIVGHVRNLEDGSVFVEATGATPNVNTFIAYLKVGPEFANVRSVNIDSISIIDESTFSIKK